MIGLDVSVDQLVDHLAERARAETAAKVDRFLVESDVWMYRAQRDLYRSVDRFLSAEASVEWRMRLRVPVHPTLFVAAGLERMGAAFRAASKAATRAAYAAHGLAAYY